MSTIRKSNAGWIVETTHTVHGGLEQGGVCGRVVLVSNDTLRKVGIDPDVNPADSYNADVSNETYVREAIRGGLPVRVLRKGTAIR